MSVDPLSLTFDLLAATSRPDADEVLIAALGVPAFDIRDLAAEAIVARGSVRGMVELIRRFDDLSDAARRRLAEPSDASSRAFRQCLRAGDETLVLGALAAARFARRVDQAASVAELLASRSTRVRQEAFEGLVVLADRLHDLMSDGNGRLRTGRADLIPIRDAMLDAVAAACENLDRLPDGPAVLERLLSLGTPRHPAVVKALRQLSPECRRLTAEVLATSRHPGVMRLLFEFFSEPYPPRCVFEAMRSRDDPEFVAALLRWFPDEPSAAQLANFRQIDAVSWLRSPEKIADVPEPLQGRLPAFLFAIGLPDRRKTEFEEWLVRNGSAAGRRGATQVFDRLDLEATRRILLDSLDSDDEDVSAWATSQLRPRHVPNAFRLLIDRLDSSSDVVRDAARDQLRGFTLEHLLSVHDRLPPPLCRRAGQLLLKIDPDSLGRLAAMIAGPVQRQRVIAAEAAVRLGFAERLRLPLLGLLADPDSAVRRVGVEVLSADRSPEVRQALRELIADPSPRVRQAAERALAEAGDSAEVPSATTT